jgi:TRAP-type C4-dicarboxylate transport system permease small subunit
MLIKKAVITKTVSPALGIPMSNLYWLLRIGFIFMLFFLCMSSIKLIRYSIVSGGDQEEAR